MTGWQQKRPGSAAPTGRVWLAAMLIAATLTSGCKTMVSAGTSVDCLAFQPVRWSKSDTLQTIEQVREHNAVWKSLCSEIAMGKD